MSPSFEVVTEMAKAEVRQGIDPVFALLIAYSSAYGHRLDPFVPDHAAVLDHARVTLEADSGISVLEALKASVATFTSMAREVRMITTGVIK